MDVLVLGGTAWLGREVAEQAVGRGHAVTCLARGESGPVADGSVRVAGERREDGAYDRVRDRDWDGVVEVSWQPGLVRGALAALGDRAAHWSYVSSGSVYASNAVSGAEESTPLLPATEREEADIQQYGEAKVACEQGSVLVPGDRALAARPGRVRGPGARTRAAGEGFAGRSGAAAGGGGLRHRPRRELLADVLAWEREQGLDRTRRAGLSAGRERELLVALAPE